MESEPKNVVSPVETKAISYQERQLEILREVTQDYHRRYNFKPGDPIRWKRGTNFLPFPEGREPAMVLEVLAPEESDKLVMLDTSFPSWARPVDILLAVIHPNGRVTFAHSCSKFFEPYTPDEPEAD